MSNADPDVDMWCRYLLFTPLAARRMVAASMSKVQHKTRLFMEASNIDDTNIYISGSLARGEPTVCRLSSNGYRLVSDIDLLAVVKEGSTHEHPITGLESHLRRTCPGLKPTVYVVPCSGIGALRSFFARDLSVAFDRPLAETYPLAAPAVPYVGQEEQFEVLIHHLSAWLLGPAAEGARDDDHVGEPWCDRDLIEIKLLADCLWILQDVPTVGTVRYGDAYRRCDSLCTQLDRQEIELIVHAHEVHPEAGKVNVDVVGRLVKSLLRFFHITPGGHSLHQLIELLTDRAAASTDLLAVYRYSLPLFLLSRSSQGSVSRQAAEGFRLAWEDLDSDQIIDGRHALHRIRQLARTAQAADSGEPESHLRSLRKDYYHHLGAQNFGCEND
ncbi:hypothetical protein [Streptomyces hokutonensis]|uniref:Nucleotidyltransferase n=1 Tax=Streptomyces hokutonensis TaxID=1306990 RepID=A0ABW6ML45_9ACTN